MSEHAVNKVTTHHEGEILHIHKSWFTFKSLILLGVYFSLIQLIGITIQHSVLNKEYITFFSIHYFVFSWFILSYLFFATCINHTVLVINANMLVKYNAPLPWKTKKIIYLNHITDIYPSPYMVHATSEGEKVKHYSLTLLTTEGKTISLFNGVESKADIDMIVSHIKQKRAAIPPSEQSTLSSHQPPFFQ
ncbi:hypothetical protein L4C36_11985 [Photobacterium japonica]|uniref:hypothetical protein n=1 Tax=Photobacterium japonica TaxID=2910235 RepID=UPI003D0B7510